MISVKKTAFGLSLVGLLFGVPSANATNIVAAGGTVVSVTSFTAESSYNDVIILHGVASQLPTCGSDSSGNVHVRISRNADGTNTSADRVFTLAVTAYTLGKTVTVEVTDSDTLNGACQVMYLQLN